MNLDIKRFEAADEIRRFPLGTFEVVQMGGLTIGRASYEPGWRWSEHVGPITGAASCKVEHWCCPVARRCGWTTGTSS
jgi:hypothetical protein